jgi:hypothetical protein
MRSRLRYRRRSDPEPVAIRPRVLRAEDNAAVRVWECHQGGRLVTPAGVCYVSSRPPGMLLRRTCRYHHRVGLNQNMNDTIQRPAHPATRIERVGGGSTHALAKSAVRGAVQLAMSSHAMASNRQTKAPMIPGTRVTHSWVIGQSVHTTPATAATPTTAMRITCWDRSDHRAGSNFTSPLSPPRTFAVGVRDG